MAPVEVEFMGSWTEEVREDHIVDIGDEQTFEPASGFKLEVTCKKDDSGGTFTLSNPDILMGDGKTSYLSTTREIRRGNTYTICLKDERVAEIRHVPRSD